MNPDDEDDIFNYPWLYAGLPGNWDITDAQAAKIREFLLRGGFFYADDFWGDAEAERFEIGMKKIFPDREMVELSNSDAIFHTVYDLNDRIQILGEWGLRSGSSRGRIHAALVGRLRRQGPYHGGGHLKFRHRRFLGIRGPSGVSREVLGAGNPHRRELRGLLLHALDAVYH